jgi:hypothetical protein
MTANVLSPSVAAAVPIKSCHRLDRTDFKWLTEHISGGVPPTAAISGIVSQHCRPSTLPCSSEVNVSGLLILLSLKLGLLPFPGPPSARVIADHLGFVS